MLIVKHVLYSLNDTYPKQLYEWFGISSFEQMTKESFLEVHLSDGDFSRVIRHFTIRATTKETFLGANISDGCFAILPFSMILPKTEASLSRVEQFHLWNWNCVWHSVTPMRAPSPRLTISLGWPLHMRRCLPTRPGMLSQSTPAPTAWRGSWLINLQIQTQEQGLTKHCELIRTMQICNRLTNYFNASDDKSRPRQCSRK